VRGCRLDGRVCEASPELPSRKVRSTLSRISTDAREVRCGEKGGNADKSLFVALPPDGPLQVMMRPPLLRLVKAPIAIALCEGAEQAAHQ
jgi:hypothetical protein